MPVDMTGGSLRVLVAEDEVLAAVQIKQAVETHGHTVVGIARTGAEAVAMCRSHCPDIVLMDIGMPEMDGLEATRLIMADIPTCVVIVTARPDSQAVAGQAGAMAHAAKPLMVNQIPVLFAQACRRFAQHRSGATRPADN